MKTLLGNPRPVVPETYRAPAAGRRSWLDAALSAGVVALLYFGPLAFGAVEPWARALLQTWAAALLLLWAVKQFLRREAVLPRNPLLLPMLLVGAGCVLQLGLGLSAYPYATVKAGLLYAAYFAVVFVAAGHFRREWLPKLALALTVLGFTYAVFAIVQGFTSEGLLYWVRKPRLGGMIYGSYVNHNHYAGLMEMLMPMALVLAVSGAYRGSQRVLLGFAAIVMAASVFTSLSRGGMLAILVQMLFLAACIFLRGRRRSVAVVLALLLVATVVLLLWLGQAESFAWLATVASPGEEHVAGSRLRVAGDSLRMIADRPLLGFGLGTFTTVYPAYRSFYSSTFMNAAHNDYLQLMVDTGLLGLVAIVWFIFVLYRRGLRNLADWSFSASRSVRLAALVGCTGILVHSLVDFNLQIPANALLFFVLAAVASGREEVETISLRRARAEMQRKPAPGAESRLRT